MSTLMTTYGRRQTILRLIHERSSVHVTELAKHLDVSEGTIRNDLTALEEEQLIVRVRGGAIMPSSPPLKTFATRAQVNFEAKRRIARWAADMVEDGDAIALDASTTVLNIAAFLSDRRSLTVITNGIEVGRALAQNPTNTVILLGGVLRSDGNVIKGALGEPMLKDLRVKTAFVSCVGLTLENGLSESDVLQAQTKSLLLQIARRTVLLSDASKFGRTGLVPFASLKQISHIVTDDEIAPDMIADLRRNSVTLTVCGEDTVDTIAPYDLRSKPHRIGFANLSEDLLFAIDVRRGLERAAQHEGHVDLVLADNHLDSSVALSVADHLIARKVDLVIEYQLDEKTGNLIMDKLQRANIPVIAVDIPMMGATYFGVDNFRAGHMAGTALAEWIADNWQGKVDTVIALEEPRSGAITAARIQGQLVGLQEMLGDSAVANVTYLDSGNTREVSTAHVLDKLGEMPDARRIAFICFNDDAAIGALSASQQSGRLQDVVIVGQGADRRVQEELRKPDSRIIGSTAFLPEQYGERLIELALKVLRSESVPPAVYMDHVFINKSNVEMYYPQ